MTSIETKLKALLNLAANASTEGEAQAAAAQAAKLAEKYRIDVATLPGGSVDEARQADDPLYSMGQRKAWQMQLAGTLSRANNCKILYVEKRGDMGRTVSTCEIFGTVSDVAIVRHMFAFLVATLTRLAMRHGRKERNSFLLGAVVGIREQLDAAKVEARAGVAGSALVRIDAAADRAAAEMHRLHPHTSMGRTVGASSRAGFGAGKRAGAGLHLGKSLAGGRLLGQ